MNKFRNNLSLTLAALAMLLVSMLFVAGCGSNKSQQSASSYKVVDDQGVEVDFDQKPTRIVSMTLSTDAVSYTHLTLPTNREV